MLRFALCPNPPASIIDVKATTQAAGVLVVCFLFSLDVLNFSRRRVARGVRGRTRARRLGNRRRRLGRHLFPQVGGSVSSGDFGI